MNIKKIITITFGLLICPLIFANDKISDLDNFYFQFLMNEETPYKINLDLNFQNSEKKYKFHAMSAQTSMSKIMKLTFYGVEGDHKFKNLIILCPQKEINPNGTRVRGGLVKIFYVNEKKLDI